jgi:hypothetical protein
VDGDGQVFSEVSSTTGSQSAYQSTNPYLCTQESQIVQKGKVVSLVDNDDAAVNVSDYEDLDMGEEDFGMMEELRRKEHTKLAKMIEMGKNRDDPLQHYEGDKIEDIFVSKHEPAPELVPEQARKPSPEDKKKRKLHVDVCEK